MKVLAIYLVIALKLAFLIEAEYQPTWESLSTRPLPSWFPQAKFGILIHWGLYAAQGIFGETFYEEWIVEQQQTVVDYMNKYYPIGFEFKDLVPLFTCEFFDANIWANLIKISGARYAIVSAKYNDGYALWRSSHSPNWNSAMSGPKRSFVDELAAAIRNSTNAHFGLLYSFQDVFNTLFIADRQSGFRNNDYALEKLLPELKELVTFYKPDILWIDGATSADAPYVYYNSTYFLAWLYNKSQSKGTIVVNDKWGKGTACKQGGYFSCSPPAHSSHTNSNNSYAWESTIGISRQGYGYRATSTLSDYRTTEEIIEALVSTVSMGGNLLLAIGATKDGRIIPYVEERLIDVGNWLKLYGEAIFDSVPCESYRDSTSRNIWYTCKKDAHKLIIYVILLKWPSDDILRLQDPKVNETTKITLIGQPKPLEFTAGAHGTGVVIELPQLAPDQFPNWAWVFKIA